MNRRIFLWPGEAPYSSESPGQAQPSVTEFRVPGSRGAVIVCPGGGYEVKAGHEGAPIAEMLSNAGISAYVLDYRVVPFHPLAPLSDALRAIRVVRAMGYEKVAILGFSAGGHLCSSAATLYTPGDPDSDDPVERLSSRPDAFIPCYGEVTLNDYTRPDSWMDSMRRVVDDPYQLPNFYITPNVTPDTPPAFIWHTADDQVVSVQDSLALGAALAKNGVPFEMHIFPHGPHGLGLAENAPDVAQWTGLCRRWLRGLGYAQQLQTK